MFSVVSSGGEQALPSNSRQIRMRRKSKTRTLLDNLIPVVVNFALFKMQFLALKFLPKSKSLRCFLMFLTMGLVCWKANTTSGLMNQQSLFSTLPDEVRLLFVVKSKKPLISCIVLESSNWSRNLHPGSPLCWLSPKRMVKFAYASTQRI